MDEEARMGLTVAQMREAKALMAQREILMPTPECLCETCVSMVAALEAMAREIEQWQK